MDETQPKPEVRRDALGRLLPGYATINPSGKPKGCVGPGTYLRYLLADDVTEADLKRITRGYKGVEPVAKRIAARMILAALDDKSKKWDQAVDRLLDRTEGRPAQAIMVESAHRPDPAAVLARARAALLEWQQRKIAEKQERRVLVEADEPKDLVD